MLLQSLWPKPIMLRQTSRNPAQAAPRRPRRRVRSNPKAGAAQPTPGLAERLLQVRRAKLRPECSRRRRAPRRPSLGRKRTNSAQNSRLDAGQRSAGSIHVHATDIVGTVGLLFLGVPLQSGYPGEPEDARE